MIDRGQAMWAEINSGHCSGWNIALGIANIGLNGAALFFSGKGLVQNVKGLDYLNMTYIAQNAKWSDIDGGPKLTELLEENKGIIKPNGVTFEGTIYRCVGKQYNPLEMSQYTINSNHRYTEEGMPGLYFSNGEKIVKAELANYGVYDLDNRIMYSYDVKLTNMLGVARADGEINIILFDVKEER